MGLLSWFKRLLGLEVEPPPSQSRESKPPAQAPSELRTPTPPETPAPPKLEPAPPTVQTSDPPPKPEPKSPSQYSGADFLPIEKKEMHAEAKNVGWGGPWFGRRDIIPPAGDPRTKLINRGMVTQGFLSPEELAEIHSVGAEMDKVRPQLELLQNKARATADQIVEQSQEEKEAIKRQKKAEAAARKRQYEADVAHRKATDIIYVGRGVSGRMGLRDSDMMKLTDAGLPVLSTPADLAGILELSVSKLRWLCYHTEAATRIHYIQFEVPKKSGGVRVLSAPHRTLSDAQYWILENILDKLRAEESAHGFLPGKSILTNAQAHAGKGIVVNLDLEDFFPSIGFPRVRALFQRLGYSPAVATLLALLCTECPRRAVTYNGTRYFVATGERGLPQGACTSPALSNQIARKLDRRLHGLARKFNLTYTRYADDLTFSAPKEFDSKVGYLLACIRHIAEDEGFAINPKKTRVLRQNTAQTVTGLVVNDKPNVPRAQLRRLRAILHRAQTEGLDAQNREGRPGFRAWLRGMIAYVRMTRPELGQKLLTQFEAVSGEGS